MKLKNKNINTAALTEEERRKMKRAALIKMLIIGIFLGVVIIWGSIAWFTVNRNASSSGMQIKTATLPFDIATKGSRIRNETMINSENANYVTGIIGSSHGEYAEGTSETLTAQSGTSGEYFIGDSLCLRFTPVDDPATNDVDEADNPPDIAPGSSGMLDLNIIPKVDTALDVKLSLNIVAFAEVEKKDGNGEVIYKMNGNTYAVDDNGNKIPETEIIEITDAESFASAVTTKTGNTSVSSKAADYVSASDYLRGHILFFGGAGDTTNETESSRYYYTNPYTARDAASQIYFTFNVPANNKGKAVKVPIYWMWTNTFGQVALPDNISGKRNGYPIVSDSNTAAKTLITTYLTQNKARFFVNSGDDTESYITAVTTQVSNAADFNNTAFTNLSTGYNQADNLIGTHIRYFMIEVTVESA